MRGEDKKVTIAFSFIYFQQSKPMWQIYELVPGS